MQNQKKNNLKEKRACSLSLECLRFNGRDDVLHKKSLSLRLPFIEKQWFRWSFSSRLDPSNVLTSIVFFNLNDGDYIILLYISLCRSRCGRQKMKRRSTSLHYPIKINQAYFLNHRMTCAWKSTERFIKPRDIICAWPKFNSGHWRWSVWFS